MKPFRRREGDVVVVGSGLGGLSAAAYLGRKGYRVTVLERLKQLGGYVHCFRRKGFEFEASTHFITGLSSRGYMKPALRMLGLEGLAVHEHGVPFEVVLTNGQKAAARYLLSCLEGSLERSLLGYFPHRQAEIARFYDEIRRTGEDLLRIKALERQSPLRHPVDAVGALALKHGPSGSPVQSLGMRAYAGLVEHKDDTAQDLLRLLDDERLERIVGAPCFVLGETPESASGLVFAVMLYTMYDRPTASVVGGTQQLVDALEAQIDRHGGRILYGQEVTTILVEKGRAVGARTASGEEHRARYVVSNATAQQTFGALLGEAPSFEPGFQKKLDEYRPSLSCFQVYLGLPFDPRVEGGFHAGTTFFVPAEGEGAILPDPSEVDAAPFIMTNYKATNPELNEGSRASVVLAQFDRIERWRDLDDESYQRQKSETEQRIVEKATALTGLPFDRAIVRFSGTPRTMAHYSGDPNGGIVGAAVTVAQGGINRFHYKTPVDGLFLAGADAIPAGSVSACLDSGIFAGNEILAAD